MPKGRGAKKAKTPRKPPTRISADERKYHASVVQRIQAARQMAAEIQSAEAAFRSWGQHLHEKYGLGPGDGVDEEGNITRQAQG